MSELIHVTQFYECVLCFSIPLLVIQQCYLCIRQMYPHYHEMRFKKFLEEDCWMERTALERQVGKTPEIVREGELNNNQQLEGDTSQRPVMRYQVSGGGAGGGSGDDSDSEKEERSNSNGSRRAKKANREVVEIQHADQPVQKQALPEMMAIEKTRRSMEVIEEPNPQRNSSEMRPEYEQDPNVARHREQPPTSEDEAKVERAMRYIIRVDAAFEEYIPIIFTVVLIGFLMASTFVFSMVCFFGYIFSALLFNYADLLSKLRNANSNSLFSKVNYLVSGGFIIALFISFWINIEF